MPPSRQFRPLAAFTLVELLIVVAIIAILAAIAVPNFLEAQVRSKVARVKADHRSIATSIESYYVDRNKYPPEGYEGAQPSVVWDAAISLVRLTTPVAYLTSVASLRDTFLENTTVIDTSSVIGPTARSYLYVDYADFARLRFSSGDDLAVTFNGWGLCSVGPDHTTDGIAFAPWQVGRFGGSQDLSILRRVYDPTNGTVSPGDIARFGGEIPQHTNDLIP